MGRGINRLSARQVVTATPGGKNKLILCDGNGLHLQLTRNKHGEVCRSWLFQYQLAFKRRWMGLGSVASGMTLALARAKTLELRALLRERIDPLDERRKRQQELIAQRARQITFAEVAVMYHKLHRDGWTPQHATQWMKALEDYALPAIGKLPPGGIDSAAILKIVEPQWAKKHATISRVLDRISVVLDYARTSGFCAGPNPAHGVRSALPKGSRVAPTKSHPALPFVEIASLMHDLAGASDTLASAALRFLILTASRSGELLGMTWAEIDLAEKMWIVPGARMKTRREHRVPLSVAAIAVLKALPRSGDRIFPIGERRMALLLQSLRGKSVTVHGCRSSFRDWCSERTNYAHDVIEQALAHKTGSAVELAYKRTDLFQRRVRLMTDWERFCTGPVSTGAAVVPMRKAGTNE
jgi:integrase